MNSRKVSVHGKKIIVRRSKIKNFQVELPNDWKLSNELNFYGEKRVKIFVKNKKFKFLS